MNAVVPVSQTQEVDSFESLLQDVLPKAYREARFLTGNDPDAEDLVQEAALLALKGFRTFKPGTSFKAWFLKILLNTFYLKHRREGKHSANLSLDAAPDLHLYKMTQAGGGHEESVNPAREFISSIEVHEIVEAIQALPAEFRAVASLYFLDDMSYEEIAGILGCPVGTVRSRLHRGRKLLQVALWKLAEDNGVVREDEAARAMPRRQRHVGGRVGGNMAEARVN